jgi:CO/xanthine dehydrogenase FAD-binding subunit
MVTVMTVDTLQEAASVRSQGARYLAGGTLVMRAVNYGDQSFNRIVRLHRTALPTEIRQENGRIRIGAGATMSDILRSPDTTFLHAAARAIGGPAIRNMATVGGNLFAPHPYGDFTVALLALDGRARMSDGSEIALDQLLGSRDTENRLVESVSIARPGNDEFRFRKVSRTKPKGAAMISMAAWLPRQAGRISGVRIAYGAMGPAPTRVPAVEAALEGAALDEQGIARALQVAVQGLAPPDDSLASGWYRMEVAPVHLKRLLLGEGRR